MSILGIIDFIIFIANILGVIGYFTELYVFTYIAVLLILVIDIAYIILPFYRKPFIFTYFTLAYSVALHFLSSSSSEKYVITSSSLKRKI